MACWSHLEAALLALVLSLTLAHAADTDWSTEACADFCARLDAAEEACEARFGDADPLCAGIGEVEEQCDPEDSETPTCDGICARVDALDDACDERLGEADALCAALDALADGVCEGEGVASDEDGEDGEDEGGEDEGDDAPAGGDGGGDDADEDEEELSLSCAATPAAGGGLAVALGLGLLGFAVGRRR